MKYRLELNWTSETYEQTFNNAFDVVERLIELRRLEFITKEDYKEVTNFIYDFNRNPTDYAMINPNAKGHIILEITEDTKKNKTIDELINYP